MLLFNKHSNSQTSHVKNIHFETSQNFTEKFLTCASSTSEGRKVYPYNYFLISIAGFKELYETSDTLLPNRIYVRRFCPVIC